MLNPAHILETAFLLLAAFLIGATVGSLARILVLRTSRKPESVPARPPADSPASEPALVSAPQIEPVSKPLPATAPSEVPVPDFTEAVKAAEALRPGSIPPMPEVRMPTVAPLPPVEARGAAAHMAPARVAGQSTSGKLVPSPLKSEPVRPAVPVDGAPSAEVIPFPFDQPAEPGEPAADLQVTDAPSAVEASAAELTPEPIAAVDRMAAPAEPASPAEAEPERETVPQITAEPVATDTVPEVEPSAGTATTSADDDEAAAMRAIEGSWTPKRSRSARSRRTAVPDGIEIEAAPAPETEAPGRPVGIAAPRHGAKDNLTNVIGVLPIIETALNKVGIYHFDQVAELTDENIAWIEAHLGISGRIGREHWREQARELAVVSDKASRVAGKP